MKIKLTDNIAEVYELELPSGKENYASYVKKELMSLHPGFDEYSLWDYKILKENSLILAVVIDTAFYMETRTTEKFASFNLDYRNRNIAFFTCNKFGMNGKRKFSLWEYFSFIMFVVIVFSGLLSGFIRGRKPIKTEIQPVSQTEIIKGPVPYIFEVLNDIAYLCDEYNMEVLLVNYNSVPEHNLLLSVSNPKDENVEQIFKEVPNVKNVELSKTVYNDNIPYLTATLYVEMPQIFINSSSNNISDEIQVNIIEPMREQKIQMRSFDYIDGIATLEFVLGKENVSWFSKIVIAKIKELRLIPVDFNFSFNNERTECSVILKVLKLNNDQNWLTTNTELIFYDLFKLETKKTLQIKELVLEEQKQDIEILAEPDKLTKMGRVKEGDKYITYYQDENGKIIKRKE